MPRGIREQAGHLDIKRRLRSNMTDPEMRLWSALRARQLQGMKFRRQHVIGPYIVDFYCPERSFIIEVGGDSHTDSDQIVRDQLRDTYFQSLGFRVIRYVNDNIVKNLAGILEDLAEKFASGSTSPHLIHHLQHAPAIPFRLESPDAGNLQ
jgi:very-short-patch-repair endonuclease